QGLSEMFRVLAPGGRAVVLEFSEPRLPVFRQIYRFHFHRFLPKVGQWISRSPDDAYRYLPESVARFPDRWELAKRLEAAGFESVEIVPLTLGIALIHVAEKPSRSAIPETGRQTSAATVR